MNFHANLTGQRITVINYFFGNCHPGDPLMLSGLAWSG
jgi:hypothetical protein